MRWAVFIRSDVSLDDVAAQLRLVLNLRSSNLKSFQREQRRDSVNMGGAYYLFEALGLELLLLANRGEVLIEERSDFAYFLAIAQAEDSMSAELAAHLSTCLAASGITAEAGELD